MNVCVSDCLFLLCPQWSCSVQSSLWEAAALKSPQVQLLPLCPGALRPTRPTCGGGEDGVCGLCGAWQGVLVFLSACLSLKIISSIHHIIFTALSGTFLTPKIWKTAPECFSKKPCFSCNQVLNLIFPIPSKAKHIEQLTATCLHKLYPQWADDVGLKKNI